MRILLLLLILVAAMLHARAWGNVYAHPRINREALAYFQSHYATNLKYKHAPLDLTTRYIGDGVLIGGWKLITEGTLQLSLGKWLEHGGFSADEPEIRAALRHFNDPLSLTGVAYLTDQVDGLGVNPRMDAITWGLSAPDNDYTWKKGLAYYRLALESETDREANLVKALRSLGETMHLIGDMTQPAHVRNDSHPYSDPTEDTVTGDMVSLSAGDPLDSRVSLTGTPATMATAIATFTNRYFYSSDTIYDGPSGVLPVNGEARYPTPQFADLTFDAKTQVYSGTFNGVKVPLAARSLSSYIWEREGFGTRQRWHLPPAFVGQQAAVFIPIAVQGSARLIDLFFPTLTLTMNSTMVSKEQADGYRIEGKLEHLVAQDPEWKETGGAIKYSGPGELWAKQGTQDVKIPVTFIAGLMTAVVIPATYDSWYLKVTAGGREITSDSDNNANPMPSIIRLEPDTGMPDDIITIIGANFGATQSVGRVVTLIPAGTSNRIEPEILTWANDKITFRVPYGIDSPVQTTISYVYMQPSKGPLWLYIGDGSTFLNYLKTYRIIRVGMIHSGLDAFWNINGYSYDIPYNPNFITSTYPNLLRVTNNLSWNGSTFTATEHVQHVQQTPENPFFEDITITGTIDPIRRRLVNVTADMHQEMPGINGTPDTLTVQLKLKELSGGNFESYDQVVFGIEGNIQPVGYPPTPLTMNNVVSYHYIHGDEEHFTNDVYTDIVYPPLKMYVMFKKP